MSYASSNDPRVLFGLGESDAMDETRIRWPDGVEETFGSLGLRRYHTLRRGEGNMP